MAEEDRPDSGLDRARRVGRRLVERLELEPPVAIAAVVERYAELEYDRIPADCDAVVVGLTSMTRPLVIIEQSRHPRRQRFSLAHELGHILIPGHIGIEVCQTETSYYSSSPQEREAHAFASEVLMPTEWLSRVLGSTDDMNERLVRLEEAEVSAAAACLAVHRVLEPGYVLALMRLSMVEMSLVSPGTEAKRPDENRALSLELMGRYSAEGGSVRLANRVVRWWRFETETPLGEVADTRTASEILRQIVDDVYGTERSPDRTHAFSSINGIAGHANNPAWYGAATSVEQMYARLRARFADRREHQAVMDHPLFDDFLKRKAEELVAKGPTA